MSRPNIVILIADDMGYGDLGAYGASKIPTPRMDGIADRGVRFLDMHASAAVCTPSRYGLMTGRYCWRTWLKQSVLGGFGAPLIEPGEATLPALLKRNGYRTAAVGKWHLGLAWHATDGTPLSAVRRDGRGLDGFTVDYTRPVKGGPVDCGFDYWYGMAGSLDMPPYCYLENRRPVAVPAREKNPYRRQQRRGLMSDDWTDEEVDVRIARTACRLLQDFSREDPNRPFFLYVATSAPHRPCLPPAEARGCSSAGARGDMVTLVDRIAGQLLDSLETTGKLDNTLFFVTSDHGARTTDIDGRDHGHKANHDLRGQKGDIFEGGHRVPCVAMWPGVISPRSVCSEPLMLPDVAATCVDIAEDSRSGGNLEDGRSFRELLDGTESADPIHEALIHHSMDGMFAVRRGPWKLILGTGSGGMSEPRRYTPGSDEAPGQLYNLADDHREQLNLYSARPEIVAELQSYLH